MWHLLGGRLTISRQRIRAENDARCQHQPIIGKVARICERNGLSLRIDRFGFQEIQRDPIAGQLVVPELLRFGLAQSDDNLVAERAGNEDTGRVGPTIVTARRRSSCFKVRAQIAPAIPPPTTTSALAA
jgi:hypothetical protein